MDDIWLRAALVAGSLVVAGLVILVRAMRTRRHVVDYESVPLDAGIYFFSSATCPTCSVARDELDATLGEMGYTEYRWEGHEALFADLEVDAVPSVLVVEQSGSARLYPGRPTRVLTAIAR